MPSRTLKLAEERFPIAGSFTIARGSKTEAYVVTCLVSQDGNTGRGECVPYARYGETVTSVCGQIEAARNAIEAGAGREELLTLMKPGAARNAVDCALWDLEAKASRKPAWNLAELASPTPLVTAYTISMGDPETMSKAAAAAAHRPLLKVKVGGTGDPERIAAVAAAAPSSRIILDANEGWTEATLAENLAAAARHGILLIEQPLPADKDAALAHIEHSVPICADESVHLDGDLDRLVGRYDAVNIKLDKTGGLTAAFALHHSARANGFQIMVGCMVGTSLAMAPAMLLAQDAEFVDLDGPLLLAADRPDGLRYDGSIVHPPARALWG